MLMKRWGRRLHLPRASQRVMSSRCSRTPAGSWRLDAATRALVARAVHQATAARAAVWALVAAGAVMRAEPAPTRCARGQAVRLGHAGEGVGGVRGRAESVLWVRVMVRYVGAVCVPSQCRVVCVCCAVAGVCVLSWCPVGACRCPVGVSRALEPACPCRVVPCLPHPTSRSWCAVTWGSSLVVCAF